MIFKTFLKYKIFEYCLEALFEKVKVNFSVCKVHKCKIGDCFTRIDYHKNGPIWQSYYNYTIVDVTEYFIYFGFTSTYDHHTKNSYSGNAVTAYDLESLQFIR